jgi:predicted metal-dependent enzyme (double-stranded beta helix superfamily)
MKILEGELHEVRYDASTKSKLGLKMITQMREEDVAYIDDSQGVHKMVNPSRTEGAISLHIYIPPYTKCSIFNLAEGSCKQVDMTVANAYSDKPLTPMMLSASNDERPITVVAELLEKLRAVVALPQDVGGDGLERTRAIQSTLDRVHFVSEEWRDLVHFSDHHYTRMLLTLNEHFSLMLICWRPLQSCSLHSHNHAPENTMFVKPVTGSLKFCRFSDETGSEKVSQLELEAESPCLAISNKDLGWHTTQNSSATMCTLSLHLYTPPMLECVHSTGVAPVVYSKASTEMAAVVPQSPGKLHLAPNLPGDCSLFSNFQMLVETLSGLFDKHGESSMETMAPLISKVVKRFEFNPKEVREYGPHREAVPFIRCRVGLHTKFELYVVFWRAGEISPIHSHGGSSCFMKYFFFFFFFSY